jgi:hypothetical protein
VSSQVCWRCDADPGSWMRIHGRVWCDDCLAVALSTFVVLTEFKVPLLGDFLKLVADEHVANEVMRALEKPESGDPCPRQ